MNREMLKKIVFEGIKVGASIGSFAAIVYTWISIAIMGLVFGSMSPNLSNTLLELVKSGFLFSVIDGLLSALIGGITGSFFGLLFHKFGSRKNLYIMSCVLLCITLFVSVSIPSPK